MIDLSFIEWISLLVGAIATAAFITVVISIIMIIRVSVTINKKKKRES